MAVNLNHAFPACSLRVLTCSVVLVQGAAAADSSTQLQLMQQEVESLFASQPLPPCHILPATVADDGGSAAVAGEDEGQVHSREWSVVPCHWQAADVALAVEAVSMLQQMLVLPGWQQSSGVSE